MRLLFAFVCTMAMAPCLATASTSGSTPYNRYKLHTTSAGATDLLDGVACNALEAARTMTLWLGAAWVGTKFNVFYDYTSGAATYVTLTCTESLDGTAYGVKTTASCSGGTCDHAQRIERFAVSGADLSMILKMDTEAAWRLECIAACVGGSAGETLTVQAVSFIGR